MIINNLNDYETAHQRAYQTLEGSTFGRESFADFTLNRDNWIISAVGGSTELPRVIKFSRGGQVKEHGYAQADTIHIGVNNFAYRELDYYIVNLIDPHNSFDEEDVKVTHQANKHLNNLYAYDENQNSEALNYLFDVIETAFSNRDLLLVDSLLANVDITKTRQVIYVGLLRGTYRARKQLSYWSVLRTRVSEQLKKEGKKMDWILRGLLKPDDRYTLTSESRA